MSRVEQRMRHAARTQLQVSQAFVVREDCLDRHDIVFMRPPVTYRDRRYFVCYV